MNYSAEEEDNALINKTYEHLNVKTGDIVSIVFSGEAIELRKTDSQSKRIELNRKLIKAVERAKKGEKIREDDIFKMMKEMKTGRNCRRF